MESKSMVLVYAITANCPYHTPSIRPWGILWEEGGVGEGVVITYTCIIIISISHINRLSHICVKDVTKDFL